MPNTDRIDRNSAVPFTGDFACLDAPSLQFQEPSIQLVDTTSTSLPPDFRSVGASHGSSTFDREVLRDSVSRLHPIPLPSPGSAEWGGVGSQDRYTLLSARNSSLGDTLQTFARQVDQITSKEQKQAESSEQGDDMGSSSAPRTEQLSHERLLHDAQLEGRDIPEPLQRPGHISSVYKVDKPAIVVPAPHSGKSLNLNCPCSSLKETSILSTRQVFP